MGRIIKVAACSVVSGFVLAACAAGAAEREELVLAEDGRSDYVIVVADDASPATKHGAEELRMFLKEMTGTELPIASDTRPLGRHEIILGDNAHLKQLDVNVDFARLGNEGYLIKTVGHRLVIAGGELRGNMYGVYGLLEDHLGCRWFTAKISRIPACKRLALGKIDDTQVPILEQRYPFTTECFDPDWSARNRMNGSDRLTKQHGGYVKFGAGLFVHSFNRLCPPEKHFGEHPEYFSEINGRRIKDHTQLCCTNEDVIRIVSEATLAAIRTDPDGMVFSVSQNDWGNCCQCARCRALAEKEGSQMGPLLHLVNRVAEAVEKEFPNVAIETLAYQWSRKAPKNMRPRPNVIIRLCSIECCFSHPLETCDGEQNRAFVRDITDWARVCNRLWVWDYVTSFPHYLLPFPNQRVRDDNIRFFIRNNVKGIFEQDCYNTLGSEFAEMGGYMTAKFLWNPDYGEDRAMNEFLEGVYGAGAPFIRRYLDLLHDRVEKENIHVAIWVGPDGAHLNDQILLEGVELFDKAEAAVADRPDVLARVKTVRACVDYALFERARRGLTCRPKLDHERFMLTPHPVLVRRFEPFFAALAATGMRRLSEWHDTDFADYRKQLEPLIRELRLKPHETASAGDVIPGLSYEYYEGQWNGKLPDFDKLQPVAKGTVDSFTLKPGKREENIAFRFKGFIKAANDGVYSFTVSSDDGSRLYVGDELVVDNDGLHAMAGKSGCVGLKAGMHPIRVEFFQQKGDIGLEVTYEGPGLDKQPVPAPVLYRRK